MKVLFDQGTPVPLRRYLRSHEVSTAYELGWSTGILSDPQHGTAEQIGIDGIKYTPATGYTGSDSFVYQHIGCSQCFEGWCAEPTYDTATVYIAVTN